MGKYKVQVEMEPGIILQIPHTCVGIDYYNLLNQDYKTVSTNKGNCCYWDVKTLIRMSFDDVAISLGYSLSNLDIYSSYRHLSTEGVSFEKFYPDKKLTHSAFFT
jgi:hypothetical protein